MKALSLVGAVSVEALVEASIEALDQGVAIRVDRGPGAELQQRDHRQKRPVLQCQPVS